MASADYKFVAPAGDGDTLVGPYITSLANDRSLNVDPGHWFHSSRALEMPDGSKLPPSIRVAVHMLVPAMMLGDDLAPEHPFWLPKLSVLTKFLKALRRAGLPDALSSPGPEAARAACIVAAAALPAAQRTLFRGDVMMPTVTGLPVEHVAIVQSGVQTYHEHKWHGFEVYGPSAKYLS